MEENKKNKNVKLIPLVCIVLAVLLIGGGSFLLFTKDEKKEEKPNQTEEKEEKKSITPLMYEVTKEGSNNKIYLFGSMHMVNFEDFDFPNYVMDAYDDSDYLAVEFDIIETLNDEATLSKELEMSQYPDKTTIKDHVSEETYNKLVDFLTEKQIYNSSLDMYNANFFSSLLLSIAVEDANISSDQVDTYFLDLAKNEKKEILEVESYEFQSDLLNSFSDRLYELELLEFLDNYGKSIEDLKEVYEIWKNGDPEELVKIASDFDDINQYSEEDAALINDYNKKVVSDRNKKMTEVFEQYFDEEKKVFFMVGAAHLVGDDGIANLLKADGYTVVQVNK